MTYDKEEITISTSENKKQRIEPWVFFPPLVFFAAFCLWVFKDAEQAAKGLQSAFRFVTHSMAWTYEWYVLFLLALCFYFIFGPYATKKLGVKF